MKTRSFSNKLVSAVLAMTMLLSVLPAFSVFAREYAADLSINGETVAFENQVYSRNDIIYVPLEELCGYLNLTPTREGDTYTIDRLGQVMKVQIGNLAVFVDGKEVKLTTHPEEKDGVVYVPAELFSLGFSCPLTVAEDNRSADLVPNVYNVAITQEDAAATRAEAPDKDMLAVGTSANDVIFNNLTNFPNMEKSLFYKIDLEKFSGLNLEQVLLCINIDKAEYNPSLQIYRTAPWTKGEVTYNTQPAVYETEVVKGSVAESGFVDKQYDITTLAKNAVAAGEDFAVKLIGVPHSSKMTSKNNSFSIKGVNTTKAPYALVSIAESYVFPIKTETVSKDADEYKYSAFALLKSLGVFTESDEFPLDMSEGVQRQEFVKFALRLRNTAASSGSGTQFFSDVPVDAPFYADVMTAYSLGLIAGWEGIEFRPYDRITVGEAITILGRMLNYNIYADERGGFTPGYFAAARLGDLYVGGSDSLTELSFSKMINLFEDALDAKMLNVLSYKSDGTAEYVFDENMTILTEYWNAKKIEGTVTANEYSNIVPGADGKDAAIVIDSKELTLNYEPYNQFLGYRVKGWYNDEDVLLYLGTKESSITEIELADIQSVSETASSVSFSYKKDNGNYSNQSFSKASTVIYNGKSIAQSQVNASLLSADGGNIKLVGNNLTIITAYSTIIVYSVQPTEEVIYDRYDAYNKVMRLSGKDYTLRDKDGKDIALDTIKENDVISAAVSLDGELINAIVSTKKVTGTITTAENLGTEDQVLTIGGSEYETRNLTKTADDASAEYWTDYIKLGANGTFLIDAFGYIVGFISTKTTDIKGYVLTMDTAGGSALNKKLQMAVMVQGSEDYVVYDLADKVEIDGTDYKQSSEKDKILAKFQDKETEEFIKQGIIFDLNSEGKVCVIDTAYFDSEKEDEQNSLHKRYDITDAELRYKSNGAVGPKTSGNGGAMFYVYLSKALGVVCYDTNSIDEYEVKTSGLSNDGNYSFEIYTIGTETPEAAIVYRESNSSTTSVGDDPHLMLCDKVVTAFDSEGYEIKKLYYYSGTKRSSVTIPDDMVPMLKAKTADSSDEEAYAADPGNSKVIGEISRGDIIRFEADDRGEVTAIEECFDYETKTFVTNRLANFNHLTRTYGGYTGIVNGNYIKITQTADLTDEGTYSWMDSKKFNNFCSYEVSSAGIDVKAATLADVRSVKNVPYNPTGIILQSAYESLRSNVWLLEMNQPDGTGIYKLSYKTVAPEGSTEPVSGVPESYTRYNPGDWAEVTANVPSTKDYTFKGWVVSGGDGTLYKAGDLVPINGDTVLEPTWVYTPTYTVTFKDAATGTTYTEEWAEKDENLETKVYSIPGADSPAATALEKNGYELIGWKQGTDTYEFGKDYSVTGAVTFEAIWMRNWSGTAATTAPALVDGYYQLENGEDLAYFSNLVKTTPAAKAKLINDIYLNNFVDSDGDVISAAELETWYKNSDYLANANAWTDYTIDAFAGEFDGNGKTIYGAYMRGASNTGFFSTLAGGSVKNVTFKGAYLECTSKTTVSSGAYNNSAIYKPVGIVAGAATGTVKSTISDVTTYGRIVSYNGGDLLTASGILGQANGVVDITNAKSYVDIIDTDNATVQAQLGTGKTVGVVKAGVGGIVGFIGHKDSGKGNIVVNLTNCYNYGNIIVSYANQRIGGLVGHYRNGTLVFSNCGNAGNIRAYSIGGSAEMYGYRTSSNTDAIVGATDALTGGSKATYDPTEVIQ